MTGVKNRLMLKIYMSNIKFSFHSMRSTNCCIRKIYNIYNGIYEKHAGYYKKKIFSAYTKSNRKYKPKYFNILYKFLPRHEELWLT